jgi:hypothetical protein
MTLLMLSSGISYATFDIEDPSKIVQEDIKRATEAYEAAQESASTGEKVPDPDDVHRCYHKDHQLQQ